MTETKSYVFKMERPVHVVNLLDGSSRFSIPREVHNSLIKKITDMSNIGDSQNGKSNINGFHSDRYMNIKDKEFDVLSGYAMQIASKLYGEYISLKQEKRKEGIRNVKFQKGACWGMSFGKGDSVKEHNHISALWAWSYYLQTPVGSSPLVFPQADLEIYPKEGDIIIFDGNLIHSVPPCECEEKRLVIAGNIEIVPEVLSFGDSRLITNLNQDYDKF